MIDFKLSNVNGAEGFYGPMDWSYSPDTNIFNTVEEDFMLVQLLNKDMMTQYGVSVVNPQYGSSVAGVYGMNISPVLLGGLVTNEVKRVVGLLQRVLATVSQLLPTEKISSIQSILISVPSGNPTQMMATVKIINQAQQILTIASPMGTINS